MFKNKSPLNKETEVLDILKASTEEQNKKIKELDNKLYKMQQELSMLIQLLPLEAQEKVLKKYTYTAFKNCPEYVKELWKQKYRVNLWEYGIIAISGTSIVIGNTGSCLGELTEHYEEHKGEQ